LLPVLRFFGDNVEVSVGMKIAFKYLSSMVSKVVMILRVGFSASSFFVNGLRVHGVRRRGLFRRSRCAQLSVVSSTTLSRFY